MLKTISDIIWFITTFFIMYVGLYYTFHLKFPQFRIINIIKSFKKNKEEKSNTFKLLNLTLAGKIGVGSISGIALCIWVGGISSLFYLWLSAIFLASLSYVETKLGIKYREKNNGEYLGGPSLYIEKGLKNKKLARIYSLLIIIAYVFAFTSIQSNTIVLSFENLLNVKRVIIVIFLVIMVYLSISKGVKTISNITSILVPVMGSIYIAIGLFVIFNNFDTVLVIIKNIVLESFNIKGLKSFILVPIVVGIERGIFSNEAGIGTTAMVASLSNSNVERQANIQMLGTFFTSLIVCTITALIVLTSNYQSLTFTNINGIEIVFFAFYEHFGYLGIILLTAIIFLFAFSTIVTCYYYGEINTKYLFKKNKYNTLLKIVVIIVIVYSSFASPSILWNIVDIIVALIALINIYAMYKLKDEVNDRE